MKRIILGCKEEMARHQEEQARDLLKWARVRARSRPALPVGLLTGRVGPQSLWLGCWAPAGRSCT